MVAQGKREYGWRYTIPPIPETNYSGFQIASVVTPIRHLPIRKFILGRLRKTSARILFSGEFQYLLRKAPPEPAGNTLPRLRKHALGDSLNMLRRNSHRLPLWY